MECSVTNSILRIEGGTPLNGSLEIPGSKNSALAILSSVVLCEGTTVLQNVPDLTDIRIKTRLLERLGAKIERQGSSLYIDCTSCVIAEPDPETVRAIRTSFYLFGPLLGRVGHARMPAPGGCNIGARPVDFHIKGLQTLGAKVDLVDGIFVGYADGLKGGEIYLDFPSAGATQHLMASATLAEGSTIIRNAALEPEITILADFLNRMGARIEGAGTNTITIEGVKKLHANEFRVPSDRLQAGTYLLAAAITRGDVTVTGVHPEPLGALANKLREAGAEVSEGPDWVRVEAPRRLKGIKIKTMPYPGFPTDLQQPMAAVLSLADGTSVVEETIYESRIGHIPELVRMGAQITLEGRSSVITGVKRLSGAQVEASDLRAGAALCLAGLAAQGETLVRNVNFIDRGYERIEHNLNALGARVQRITASDHEAQASPETYP
jgi:UDP-N-acetylglucosamine 1-carboxyvinyltransferase